MDDYSPLLEAVEPQLALTIRDAEVRADLKHLRERVPQACVRGAQAIDRVAKIVRAMREFSHPPTTIKAPVDLNQAIETTLTVATNEFKYVADVETDFGDLPPVTCDAGDINQVFLNLIVDAAHATADAMALTGERGTIRIATACQKDTVTVTVADTGTGFPDDIRGRIFDPFFTTKAVGFGTGQGLAIVHSVVVEKHAGAISVESEAGRGATFTVALPIEG